MPDRAWTILIAAVLFLVSGAACSRYPIPTITPYATFRPIDTPVASTPQAVIIADRSTPVPTPSPTTAVPTPTLTRLPLEPTPTLRVPSATPTTVHGSFSAAAESDGPTATPEQQATATMTPPTLLAPFVPTATQAPTETATPTLLPPSFLQQRITNLFDLSRLPVLENSTTNQFTSRNWTFLEHYFDYFIDDGAFSGPDYGYLTENGSRVPYRIVAGYDGKPEYEIVPRTAGPGSIERIWFAYQQHESVNNPKDMSRDEEWANWGNLRAMGNIRLYFDDETIPSIDFGIKNLFVGKRPFPAPLAAFYASANGGNINYVPIPFRRSIRMTSTGRPRLMQVQVKRFPSSTVATFPIAPTNAGATEAKSGDPNPLPAPRSNRPAEVESFRLDLSPQEESALDQAVQAWRTCSPAQSGEYRTFTLEIAHNTSSAVEFTAPATIAHLRVRVPLGMEDSVWMQVFWDGEKTPSMTAPLRGMFGTAERLLPYSALLMGTVKTANELVFYNHIPMPFQSARFVFINDRAETLQLALDVITSETLPGTENARLHAFYGTRRVQRREDNGDNYVIIDVKGRGKYLGTIFSAWDLDRGALNGPLDEHWRFPYLESNMDVWIDGRMALPGTGIEDDFNAGYYYVFYGYPGYNSKYCLSGVTLLDYAQHTEPSSQYRFYLNDAPEFRNHLSVQVEHGNKGNNLSVTYSSTAFWYQMR